MATPNKPYAHQEYPAVFYAGDRGERRVTVRSDAERDALGKEWRDSPDPNRKPENPKK